MLSILCHELAALQRGETRDCCGFQFKLEFFLDAVGNAPIYRIGEITCPVLFLQGLADNAKRRGDALMGHEYMQRAKRRSTLVEVPGGNHELDNVVEQRTASIRSWLQEIGMI
jgi:pimeloyl-ACP methyl ester carboxylesterase